MEALTKEKFEHFILETQKTFEYFFIWKYCHTLENGYDKFVELLKGERGYYYKLADSAIQHEFILGLGRLIDTATFKDETNLSIEYIVQSSSIPDLATQYKDFKREYENLLESIKNAKNKKFSHNDYATAGKSLKIKPGIEELFEFAILAITTTQKNIKDFDDCKITSIEKIETELEAKILKFLNEG